jgi:hypothetical protein
MSERGQALIILIVAIGIALLVLTSAVLLSIGQAKISARSKIGQRVYYAAETGAEYGLIKIMRNPGSCSGADSFTLDSSDITITYNPAGSNCQITSEAKLNNLIKKVQVEASYDSGWVFDYSSWNEIP